MSTVGARIKELRKKLGLSADQLAEKVGKNRATIFRYENGDIENMSPDVIPAIAEALGTTPAVLMGWDQSSPEDAPSEDIEKAMQFYERYKKAIPQVQNVIRTLLESDQSDS